ncbi:MAG: hypothetical protein HY927_12715 [Elusimicrobia bacterium]|nr:hypothetical protein [Elusimicrobiota bacterium]
MSVPVRVGLAVVDDGLYTHRWAAALLQDAGLRVPFAVCLSPWRARGFNPRGGGAAAAALSRLAYYGWRDTAVFAARAAASAAVDARWQAGLGGEPRRVASAARAKGVPVLRPPGGDINDASFCGRLASHRPDLIVCAFSQKAGARFLSVPLAGCLNVHFSLLPLHRGREPLMRAMLAGRGAGVSAHWMTEGVDEGAVVAQEPVGLEGCRTLDEAILKACAVAARLLPRAVRLAVDAGGPAPASGALGPRRGWPTPDEVAEFREKGFRFV